MYNYLPQCLTANIKASFSLSDESEIYTKSNAFSEWNVFFGSVLSKDITSSKKRSLIPDPVLQISLVTAFIPLHCISLFNGLSNWTQFCEVRILFFFSVA